MSLLSLVITLVLVGVALYLINLIQIDATIKKVIYVVVILFLVLWVLQNTGLLAPLEGIRIR